MCKTKRLKLKKLPNTRDLGGLKTTDGKVIKYGKLIRSGKLSSLPRSTRNALLAMGDLTVIDLRIPVERSDNPDVVLENMNNIQLPLMFTATPGVTHDKKIRITALKESYRLKEEFGTIDNYMIQVYRSILFNEEPQERLKKFLRLIIDAENPVIFHCSSGKDRAGICAMLIESLLGVDEETVLNDYAISETFLKKEYFWKKVAIVVAPVSIRFKKVLFAYLRIKREFMATVIEEMKSRYGGVREYCQTVLKVTDEDIETLKEKYLEDL